MKELPVMSSARTANPSSSGSSITAVTTLLKYLGISAQSVAWSQTIHREAITAGVVDAELR